MMEMKEYVSRLLNNSDPADIEKLLKSFASEYGRGDKIEQIKAMTSLAAVRRAKQIAQAKLSKAKDDETYERYKKEIDTCDNQIEKLMSRQGSELTPVQLVDLGEKPGRVLQVYLAEKESELEIALSGTRKAERKRLLKLMPANNIPESIIQELTAISRECLHLFTDRLKKGDKRVENVVKQTFLAEGNRNMKSTIALNSDNGNNGNGANGNKGSEELTLDDLSDFVDLPENKYRQE